MKYEKLHQRYGSHIAKRVQAELDDVDFDRVALEELVSFLENRAVTAMREYQDHRDDAVLAHPSATGEVIDLLHRHWREAEELAYLVEIAEDVSFGGRSRSAG